MKLEEWHTSSVVGAIEDLSELVIKKDPTRIERLWPVVRLSNCLFTTTIAA